MSDLERNKQNVVAFYDLMFNQSRPREAIERYVGDDYIQHNPSVADGPGCRTEPPCPLEDGKRVRPSCL